MSEQTAPTHFRACCRNVIQVLQKTGALTPELDARLLISNALGLQGAAFFLQPDRLLSESELSEIAQRLARRMAGEPVSRIVGKREFWKHEFRLAPDVLDPRPDSETLIEVALELLAAQKRSDTRLRILDLGTGSGALLLSMLLEFPDASGMGVDMSAEALEIAGENAVQLGCGARAKFLRANWLDGFTADDFEPFDLIICNPPYIPEAEIEDLSPEVSVFDPRMALDGGIDGLDPYREIIPQLSRFLSPQGLAIFETGEGQHEAVWQLLRDAGFTAAGAQDGCYRDLAGVIRCIAASFDPSGPLIDAAG